MTNLKNVLNYKSSVVFVLYLFILNVSIWGGTELL